MGDEESSSSHSIPSDLRAILEAQKNVILSAVNTQIQGLQSNLLKAQTDLASQGVGGATRNLHLQEERE